MSKPTTVDDPAHAWRHLHQALTQALRPHTPDTSAAAELAARIIADHIAAPGWRPPLRHDPAPITQARRQRTYQALTGQPAPQ